MIKRVLGNEIWMRRVCARVAGWSLLPVGIASLFVVVVTGPFILVKLFLLAVVGVLPSLPVLCLHGIVLSVTARWLCVRAHAVMAFWLSSVFFAALQGTGILLVSYWLLEEFSVRFDRFSVGTLGGAAMIGSMPMLVAVSGIFGLTSTVGRARGAFSDST
ncbi:MAG: hypothetical protein AAGB34_05750, partial [Planctomycetota bacterium]